LLFGPASKFIDWSTRFAPNFLFALTATSVESRQSQLATRIQQIEEAPHDNSTSEDLVADGFQQTVGHREKVCV
jgi:hypothetical protein